MSKPVCIFVVDDEPQVLSSIKRCLRNVDATLHTFESPIKAIEMASKLLPDIIITDQRMPFMKGTEMLAEINKSHPSYCGVLVSAFNDLNDVTDAFNQDLIHKYLSKPWDNDELRMIVNSRLDESRRLTSGAEQSESDEQGFYGIITESSKMLKAFEYIQKASKANIPVFITGETGTGKELAAKAFHKAGLRKDSLFVAVNCANFSETLMESQLFGHVKGAFTGAVRSQTGLLESAGDGVIFLDEITCLPLDLQAKLLRVLQEREFTPIGAHSPKKFHAQIVSASSTPLSEAVSNGEFREDLYYRLNVITVELPPLRERDDDVLLLAEHFLKRFAKDLNKQALRFTDMAREKLRKYHWPGNIRQLENLTHSLVVLSDGDVIEAEQIDIDVKMPKPLPVDQQVEDVLSQPSDNLRPLFDSGDAAEVASTVSIQSKIKPLWKSEKEAIELAINAYEGNIPRAAAALEVSPSTLYRKLQSWKT